MEEEIECERKEEEKEKIEENKDKHVFIEFSIGGEVMRSEMTVYDLVN